MMSTHEESCRFQSVANFRRIPFTNMFRSARPDKISEEEVDKLIRLNIQAIYDLRSLREYPHATGQKMADNLYQPCIVKNSGIKPNASHFIKIDKNGKELDVDYSFQRDSKNTSGQGRNHFVFDLLSDNYIRAVISELPMTYKIIVYFVGFLQKIFGGGLFQKVLVQLAINCHGLLGQYTRMIDFCGKEISAVLHLMSEPENVPGVVCCAHGKDRTGILSALLMGLSGADKHSIALEYNRTEEYSQARGGEVITDMTKYGLNSSFTEAKYRTMASLIDYIEDKYGSVAGYLSSIGFDAEDQKRLLVNIHVSPTKL